MLPTITIDGRLVADPELRFTSGGKAVCSIRIAASESKKTDTGWEDGDKLFLGASIWESAGEAAAEALRKGDKVLVTGRLFQREYETSAGEKRTSLELKFPTVAKVVEAPRGERSGGQATAAPRSNNDPWSTSPADDSPPF